MTGWQLAFLFVAGIGGGLTGSVAGLASLVSYPALLAVGLPPVVANVTNTVAMFATTVGSVAGSRQELRGQGRVLWRLSAVTALGGAAGGALLLLTPAGAFAAVVPWLIALSSVLLVAAPRLRAWAQRHAQESAAATPLTPWMVAGAFAVAVYAGYFGAAAAVMMLALLSVAWSQSLARSNAAKNVATGAANLVAAVVFALVAPVNWAATGVLAAGLLVGARIGPAVVRRVPETPLRIAIGLAGLGLAVSLWLGR